MYKIKFAPTFGKSLSKITKRDIPLQEKVRKILKLLESDPKYPSLNSHKVETRLFGERWSSRVTGDIRLIWDFDEDDNVIILVLDIGGHSGSSKVYK
jgi:mRNA-degrading endonuclease YafQ of YafQ-DinJ toxin-antitoxin module